MKKTCIVLDRVVNAGVIDSGWKRKRNLVGHRPVSAVCGMVLFW